MSRHTEQVSRGFNYMTKKCSKCGKFYEANTINFPLNWSGKNGLLTSCRKCKQKYDRIYSRKYRAEHPEWIKKSNKKHKEIIEKSIKEYARKYPERIKATSKLNNAIKAHKIKRMKCFICGQKNTHGHHIDYKKPFEVIWLCPIHHKALHYNLLEIY